MNWLVLEADTTRFKVTGVHTVNDTGGQVDGNGGGSSNIANNVANTVELNSLPDQSARTGRGLTAPAVIATAASIGSGPTTLTIASGLRTDDRPDQRRIDPPGTTTEAWQGLPRTE